MAENQSFTSHLIDSFRFYLGNTSRVEVGVATLVVGFMCYMCMNDFLGAFGIVAVSICAMFCLLSLIDAFIRMRAAIPITVRDFADIKSVDSTEDLQQIIEKLKPYRPLFSDMRLCLNPGDVEKAYRMGCPRDILPFMYGGGPTFYGFSSASTKDNCFTSSIHVFSVHTYVYGWNNIDEMVEWARRHWAKRR